MVVVVHEGILALARARAVAVPSIIRIRRGGRTVTLVGVRLFRRGWLGDIALMRRSLRGRCRSTRSPTTTATAGLLLLRPIRRRALADLIVVVPVIRRPGLHVHRCVTRMCLSLLLLATALRARLLRRANAVRSAVRALLAMRRRARRRRIVRICPHAERCTLQRRPRMLAQLRVRVWDRDRGVGRLAMGHGRWLD